MDYQLPVIAKGSIVSLAKNDTHVSQTSEQKEGCATSSEEIVHEKILNKKVEEENISNIQELNDADFAKLESIMDKNTTIQSDSDDEKQISTDTDKQKILPRSLRSASGYNSSGRNTPVSNIDDGSKTPVTSGRKTPVGVYSGRKTPVNVYSGRKTPVNGKTSANDGRKTPVNTSDGRKTPINNGRKTPNNLPEDVKLLTTTATKTPKYQLKLKSIDILKPEDVLEKVKSRELKSLLDAAKESNLDTNIVHKRESRKNPDIIVSKPTKTVVATSNETSPSGKKMRSQNPEFLAKHQKFLSKVSEFVLNSDDSDNEAFVENEDALNALGKNRDSNSKNHKRKREGNNESIVDGASAEENKKLRKSLLNIPVTMKKDKDKFCWHCHRDGVMIFCETCPRSYHMRCLKYSVPSTDHWPCPECLAILHAESTKTRSPAMRDMSQEHLCELLKYAVKQMVLCAGSEPFVHPVDVKSFADYRIHVIQPMDLTTLQNNIRDNIYGSTVAFLADAKWILHNSIIYNSYQSKLTTVAKSIVKICKHEMSEIETCSECYLNANTKKNSWFVEVCSKPHMLVWAKLKGFPYWPAKAMFTNSAGLVDVRFFGAHDRAWVPIKECFLYSEKHPNMVNKQKRNNIAECIKEVNVHIEKLEAKFGTFKHAPFRVPYDPTKELEQLTMILPKFQFHSKTSSFKFSLNLKQEDDTKPSRKRGRSRSRAQSESKEKAVTPSSSKSSFDGDLKLEKSILKFAKEDFEKFTEGYGTEDDPDENMIELNSEERKKIIESTWQSDSDDELPKMNTSDSINDSLMSDGSIVSTTSDLILGRSLVRTRGGHHNISGRVRVHSGNSDKRQLKRSLSESNVAYKSKISKLERNGKGETTPEKCDDESDDNEMSIESKNSRNSCKDSLKITPNKTSIADKLIKKISDSEMTDVNAKETPSKKGNGENDKVAKNLDLKNENAEAINNKVKTRNNEHPKTNNESENNNEITSFKITDISKMPEDKTISNLEKIILAVSTNSVGNTNNKTDEQTSEKPTETVSETSSTDSDSLKSDMVKLVDVSAIISGKIDQKPNRNSTSSRKSSKEVEDILNEVLEIKSEPVSELSSDDEPIASKFTDQKNNPDKEIAVYNINVIDTAKTATDTQRKDLVLKPLSKLIQTPQQKARKTFPSSANKTAQYQIKKIMTEKKEPLKAHGLKVITTLQSIATSTFSSTKENTICIQAPSTSSISNTASLPPNTPITLQQSSPVITMIPNIVIPHTPVTTHARTASTITTQCAMVIATPEVQASKSAQPEQSSSPDELAGGLPDNIAKALNELLCKQPPTLKPRPPGPLCMPFDEGVPSSAGNVTKTINSVAHRLSDYFRGLLKETLSDISLIGSPEARIKSLELELEAVKHKHAEEMLELKKNISTILRDVQKSLIEEKAKVIDETRSACETERIRCIEETKIKTWCVTCLKEANFYCCWNTSYCDYSCQQKHWPVHMKSCANPSLRPSGTEGTVVSTVTTSTVASTITLNPKPVLKNTYQNTSKNTVKPTRMIVKQGAVKGLPMYVPLQRPIQLHTNASGQQTLTLVESTPGNFEIVGGNGGPISLGGKLIPSTALISKIKPNTTTPVSSSTPAGVMLATKTLSVAPSLSPLTNKTVNLKDSNSETKS